MRPLLTLLARLRRRVLLHRRVLAALCAAAAVLIVVQVLRPPPPPTTPAWVAARDIPAGTALDRDDLRRVDWPEGIAPGRTGPLGRLLGRTVVIPLVQGMPVTPAAVLGSAAVALHPDRTAVAVRIPDPAVAELLAPGDEIDLWLSDTRGGEPRQVVTGARVLAVPEPDGGPLDAAAVTGRVVVLAVPEQNVGGVAAAGTSGFLSVAWTR